MEFPKEDDMRFPAAHESSPRLYYSKLWGPFYRKKLEILIEYLPKEKVRKILEIGYGAGISFKELSKHAEKIYALDVHPHQNVVEEMIQKENIKNVELCRHDVFQDPFLKETGLDYVVSSSVFEHIPKDRLEAGVRNIYQALNKDGYLCIGFPLKNFWMNMLFGVYESVYKIFKKDIYDFSCAHDHPSGQDEIVPVISRYFNVEKKEYFINRFLPLYIVLKCKKKPIQN